MRYFRFDFDNNTVIEYERSGECNGCAACCMTLIRWKASNDLSFGFEPGAAWNPKNGDRYLGERVGIYTAVYVDEKWRFFRDLEITSEQHRCPALTNNNRCAIHLGKQLIHSAWPMSPQHVEPFPECSFMFQEVARWTVEEYFQPDIEVAS